VSPDGRRVERPRAQGAGERTSSFGELETLQVGVHPGTSAHEGTAGVDDGEVSLVALHAHHPQQDALLVASPAPHARPHRTRDGTRDALGATCAVIGEPDPWSSTRQSSAPCHEAGPGTSSAVSDRMSIFQPVSLAASRAFCPSLPIASDSW
jgi:hypothetical protein